MAVACQQAGLPWVSCGQYMLLLRSCLAISCLQQCTALRALLYCPCQLECSHVSRGSRHVQQVPGVLGKGSLLCSGATAASCRAAQLSGVLGTHPLNEAGCSAPHFDRLSGMESCKAD
jgi:hypothetical protein